MHQIATSIASTVRVTRGQISDLLMKLKNRNRDVYHPTVLMFHGVQTQVSRDWGPEKYAVSSETFEEIISELSKKSTVLKMDDLSSYLINGESIPDRAAVVTFDDGYRDFMTQALPILRRYDIPATIYVSTGLSSAAPATPFEQRLVNTLESRESISVSIEDNLIQSELENPEEVIQIYDEIRQQIKHRNLAFRERVLEDIELCPAQPAPVLDRDDLRSLSSESLVTIGSHGHEHIPFRTLSTTEQERNVNASRKWLTDVLGSPPEHFSFPYGSFDRSAIKAVENAGFKSAVTTRSRVVSPRDWNHPYTIPRIDAANTPIEQ